MNNGNGYANSYQQFLESKRRPETAAGFEPEYLPDWLFPFQTHLTDWSIRKGRSAIFADCGLGKSPMELVWAENIFRRKQKPVLLLTPLAVSYQMLEEGEKFGIECCRRQYGESDGRIIVTNYERLKNFDPDDFSGVVCDESSILKNYDGKLRRLITDFLHKAEYRLLASATPAPNDLMELGTASEALGEMKYSRMLGMFFVNDGETTQKWSLKGHAKRRFWQWMSTWARALRKPSDLGFEDDGYILPKLNTVQYTVKSPPPKFGFVRLEAKTLNEQRAERRDTIKERCEKVAEIVPGDRPFVAWCHLNSEGDLLENMIPDSVQVAGRHSDDRKEGVLRDFRRGNVRVLVTKPTIAGFGQNWQHCSDMSFFPSHSFEQYYQASRRCWRFGQTRPVTVNIVTSEAERLVLSNMQRKERQAAEMFDGIVREMGEYQKTKGNRGYNKAGVETKIPEWMLGV